MTELEHLLDRVLRGLLLGTVVLCVAGIVFYLFWLGAPKHG